MDSENVASEIILESLQNGKEITYSRIRSRCYDALRRFRSEDVAKSNLLVEKRSREREERARIRFNASEEVERVIKSSRLSPGDERLIYLKYYEGQTIEQIAITTSRPAAAVRESIKAILAKMKLLIRKE